MSSRYDEVDVVFDDMLNTIDHTDVTECRTWVDVWRSITKIERAIKWFMSLEQYPFKDIDPVVAKIVLHNYVDALTDWQSPKTILSEALDSQEEISVLRDHMTEKCQRRC